MQAELFAAPGEVAQRGSVKRIRFHNEENGWTIVGVDVDGEDQVWVGTMPKLRERTEIQGVGKWETSKYGKQFKCSTVAPIDPTTSEGIAEFLCSGLVAGIGPVLAERIVAHYGPKTLDVLENDLERVKAEVRGIGAAKLEALRAALIEHKAVGQIMIWLRGHGVSASLATKLYKRYGAQAIGIVSDAPYRMCMEVSGVGWKTADDLAQRLGTPLNAPDRIQAGLLHTLDEITSRGHCYADNKELFTKSIDLLGVSTEEIVPQLRQLRTDERIIEDGDTIYPKSLYDAERNVALRLHTLLTTPAREHEGKPLAECVTPAVAAFEASTGFTLADGQRAAVELVANSKVAVITGGPGQGKCLSPHTLVMRHDGTLVMAQDVREGDLLMGPGSMPRRVSGVVRGYGPMYEIRPIKGEPWQCNDKHILTLVRSATNEVRDWPLPEYMQLGPGAKWRVKGKLFRVQIDFPDQETFLDPYIMGLWLGDGSTNDVNVHKPDEEVHDALSKEAKRLGLRVSIGYSDSGCKYSGIRSLDGRHNPARNEFRTALDECGGKTIPQQYKINSREKRLRLLAGLMDTDGYINQGCCEIISKWPRLADDIAFVARSLGFAAYISDKPIQLEGWPEPRIYKRVGISGDLSVVPTRIARKQAPKRQQIKDVLRTGFDVVPIGDGDYCGWELDGDGRFLLGDFTVTHNTTITKCVLSAFDAAGIPVTMVAPTGRAAKRMNEATDKEASTIHRLLSYNPDEHGFAFNKRNKLPSKVLCVDESSMVDVLLMSSLLDALSDDARLIVVGDVDQLPSVGPGSVLRDVIDSGVVPTARLSVVYRQAAGSLIIDNAHRINRGETPITGPSTGDFHVLNKNAEADVAAMIETMVRDRIPKAYGFDPMTQIQVLTPMNKGPAGVLALNERLQTAINPPDADKPQVVRGKTTFRLGDRVLETKNDYERGVFNGDIGYIVDVDPNATKDDPVLFVSIDDKIVPYTNPHLEKLQLAYCTSIHKAQGGQQKAVIVVMLMSHFMMLSRNLLYTAVTRGEKLVVLVTEPRALGMALAETRKELRRTKLAQRLQLLADPVLVARKGAAKVLAVLRENANNMV